MITTASRPYDQDRDGFVMGEGGAALIVESLESAQNRGANVLCEIVGTGMSADAYHPYGTTSRWRGSQSGNELSD